MSVELHQWNKVTCFHASKTQIPNGEQTKQDAKQVRFVGSHIVQKHLHKRLKFKESWGNGSHEQYCSCFLSQNGIKHSDQSSFGEKIVYFILHVQITARHWGKSGQRLKVGTWSRKYAGTQFADSLTNSGLASFMIMIRQDHLSKHSVTQGGLGASTTADNSCPQANLI